MHWTKKSRQREHYCSAHNVDCPLMGHSGDPMVLDISPNLVPGGWICPQAVIEIAEHAQDAQDYLETNHTVIGYELDEQWEELLYRTASEYGEDLIATRILEQGAESLTLEHVDTMICLIENHQDVLTDDHEELHAILLNIYEDTTTQAP